MFWVYIFLCSAADLNHVVSAENMQPALINYELLQLARTSEHSFFFPPHILKQTGVSLCPDISGRKRGRQPDGGKGNSCIAALPHLSPSKVTVTDLTFL